MIMVTQICRVHGVIVVFNQLNVLKKQALWDNKSILGYAKRPLKENAVTPLCIELYDVWGGFK